jgi:hypothetical protein
MIGGSKQLWKTAVTPTHQWKSPSSVHGHIIFPQLTSMQHKHEHYNHNNNNNHIDNVLHTWDLFELIYLSLSTCIIL